MELLETSLESCCGGRSCACGDNGALRRPTACEGLEYRVGGKRKTERRHGGRPPPGPRGSHALQASKQEDMGPLLGACGEVWLGRGFIWFRVSSCEKPSGPHATSLAAAVRSKFRASPPPPPPSPTRRTRSFCSCCAWSAQPCGCQLVGALVPQGWLTGVYSNALQHPGCTSCTWQAFVHSHLWFPSLKKLG